MSSTEITNEQITAGATVLAGYKNLRLNWRNAAIDVFDAMTAAAPASADNPSTAGTSQILDSLWHLVSEAKEAAYTFGDGSKEAVAIALDGVLDLISHADKTLAAPVAQSTAGAANVSVPRATLLMIYNAMNHMGDILNEIDACEEEDEEATTPAFDAIRELLDDSYLAAPAPHAQPEPAGQVPSQWISVEDRLPVAENEDTGRDALVSDSLFIRGVSIDGGEAIGLGDYSPDAHVPEAGWRCYGGDYDFMHFAKVTHWMKPGRPIAPDQKNALSITSKAQASAHSESGGDEQPLKRCAASRDGECSHAKCPQLRDKEPGATGRHCPLDNHADQD